MKRLLVASVALLALAACEEHGTGREGPYDTPQEACKAWGDRTEALFSIEDRFADCIAYGGGKIAEYRLGDDGKWHLAHVGG